ncbi:HAD hydrolase [Stereum hirsutum FP-91666 SS1]|uniref:HAD hydrolase n=1 Tax=Stereum hirsutum (strain FP-91666) TaxID=721885 RepID=UPI000444A5C1|nr:HAD hydrolase [Stereum hirsutum FP-91666 SS1]EIM80994.1 HAD hydrolase [Stereum hirsutum FP-91666 SS1]
MLSTLRCPGNTSAQRLRLQRLVGPNTRRSITNASKPRHPPLAFCFDIDGVLLRGSSVIPSAKRALERLEGDNPWGIKIPYILMTNGGGQSEEDRCRKLTEKLGYEIPPTQFIQSHTVLKLLGKDYLDEPVMVLGGKRDTVRKVAQSYGFKKVYTPLDVKAWQPSVWPFYDLTSEELASTIQTDFSTTPLRRIFIFHDPRNWALDIQLSIDIILSNGLIGAPYILPQHQVEKGMEPVKMVFCNPDLLWRAEFERPRLGQGAFKEAFQAVFKALTGSTYPHVEQYGKPTEATYKFGEVVLKERILTLTGEKIETLPNVYMIGDNPESDIAGANAANWSSVLVRTGVYDPEQGPPTHEPTYIAEDVGEAVDWAIKTEVKRVRGGS